MQNQMVIVLKSPLVARWFARALQEFGDQYGVKIFLQIHEGSLGLSSNIRMPLFPGLRDLFQRVDLRDFFQAIASSGDKIPSLVLDPHFSLADNAMEHRSVWWPRGHILTSGGLRGIWGFFVNVFVFGSPLLIKDLSAGETHGMYFQTRNFTFRKNIGYLKYNLLRVMNGLVSANSCPLPRLNEDHLERNNIFRAWLSYPFWRLSRKFREKIAGGRWQVVRLDNRIMENRLPVIKENYQPPKGRGWADPFLVESGDSLFLFMEEIVAGKGRIVVAPLDPTNGDLQEMPEPILEQSGHLSYPFVFKEGNEWYMLPESSASEELCIYRARQFPYEWEPYRTVFSGEQWVDTTPFFHNGKWWIFSVCKPVAYASSYQDLHLFYCTNILEDQWHPHPLNPVVSDVRHARPAGRLFFYGEKLYRPAQNCLDIYGGGIQLSEVTALSESAYEERVVKTIDYPWYSRRSSLHTLTRAGEVVIGDCFL